MARDHRDGSARFTSLRGALGATVLFTLAALVGLGVGWAWMFKRTSERSAVADAGQYGELSGRAVLAPFLTDGLLVGDQEAIDNIAAAGRALISQGGAKHVKVWSKDGQILWSDEPRLIGQTFDLEPAEAALLGNDDVLADISDLRESENQFEFAAGETSLLQVYFGSETHSGIPVLIETYYPTGLVDSRAADQRRSFLPLLLGGLGLLIAAQIPLMYAVTHRLTTMRKERENLLQRVITSSDVERRRIAAEVHDGAVQDLIGITFSLSAAADDAPPALKERLVGLAGATRHTVRSLRSLLNSIYPVDVPAAGWASGLDDIVAALRQRGVEVNVSIPDVRLTPIHEQLLLRASRESLRNVDAHAQASRVDIKLTKVGKTVTLSIADNGIGFDQETAMSQRQVGHLGLQLLRDIVEEMGEVVVIDSEPGSGTTVLLKLEENR